MLSGTASGAARRRKKGAVNHVHRAPETTLLSPGRNDRPERRIGLFSKLFFGHDLGRGKTGDRHPVR